MNNNPRLNEAQYGVVRSVADYDIAKKRLHPQKRQFPDNLHSRQQVAIFGEQLRNASKLLPKGDHLFFDPSYQSEYQNRYDEFAKKSIEKYLSHQQNQRIAHGLDQELYFEPTQIGGGH